MDNILKQSQETEVPMSAEEKVFADMNAALDNIKEQRAELAQALLTAAKVTKLDPKEDAPRITEVKLALFKTVDDLLKSQESLHVTKSKMLLAKKSEATSDQVKQLAVEVLRGINMNTKPNVAVQTVEAVDEVLKKTFDDKISNNADLGGDITDDELVAENK